MASFSISRDNLTNFLDSFGADLQDIAIKVGSDHISASVGKTTHYVSRKMDCGVSKAGYVNITDLPKVKKFLSSTKVASLDVSQEGKNGTLHLSGEKVSLKLPTASYVESQKRVGMMERAIETSKEGMWRTWFNTPLTHHARVASEALKPATHFKKVLGDNYSCRTEFDADGSQLTIRGGKDSTGKMFVNAPLTNVEGPAVTASSAFDKWLPELLNSLPSGDVDIHTGDDTVMVIEQEHTHFLMVVIDQVDEED